MESEMVADLGVTVMLAVTAVSVSVTLVAVLYRVMRPMFSVKVNCWFCSRDSSVPYGNRNCWDCPHCEQYNGFSQDGDYNKAIPSQHIEDLNHSPVRENVTMRDAEESSPLCHTCNQNQLLKVKQLANFVPYNEENFDAEAETFRQHLENIYRLCRVCERRVNMTLSQQDATLRHKLEECRYGDSHNNSSVLNSSVDSACSDHFLCQASTPVHLHMLRLGSVLCAVSLLVINVHRLLEDCSIEHKLSMYLSEMWLQYIVFLSETTPAITVLGLLSTYMAIFLCGKNRLNVSDALCAFCWLGTLLLESSALDGMLKREDALLFAVMATLLSTATSVASLLARRNVRTNRIRVRKKRRNVANVSGMSDLSGASSVENSPVVSLPHQRSGERLDNQTIRHVNTENNTQEPDPHRHSDHPIASHIYKMSLGPPSGGNNRPRGMFSGIANMSPGPSNLNLYSALPQQRPLISPARFTLHTRRDHHASLNAPVIAKNLFTSHHETAYKDDGLHDNSEDESSSSNHSSICPVGSSVCEGGMNTTSAAVSWRIIIFRCFIGLSVGLNFVLFAYLLDIKSLLTGNE